jgi:hypothetical protein
MHPLQARACLTLAGLQRSFRPVSRDAAYRRIYGGLDEALVTGLTAAAACGRTSTSAMGARSRGGTDSLPLPARGGRT